MRNDAITIGEEEQHLCVPVVRRQRPTVVKRDRLGVLRTPIFVVNLRAVFQSDRSHVPLLHLYCVVLLADGTSNARPLLLPFCRRELKRSAAKDLPLRLPNTALIHRILWLDVEIHYVTSGVRKYLAGAESERDVVDVVKSVERPGPRRPEVEATVKIVDSEWLHRRELANRACAISREGMLIGRYCGQ